MTNHKHWECQLTFSKSTTQYTECQPRIKVPSKENSTLLILDVRMTQLLRGLLATTFLAILVFLSLVLFNKSTDQPTVEREKCPFAQEDYIYWSKKYKLAWCKVSFKLLVAHLGSLATCVQQGRLGTWVRVYIWWLLH